MNITLTFKPKPDISVYELALCLPYATRMVRPTPAELPKEVYRHFHCQYDAHDPEAVKWVAEVFLPNRVAHRTESTSESRLRQLLNAYVSADAGGETSPDFERAKDAAREYLGSPE